MMSYFRYVVSQYGRPPTSGALVQERAKQVANFFCSHFDKRMYHLHVCQELVFHTNTKPIANVTHWTFKCIITSANWWRCWEVVHLAGCDPTGVVDDSSQLGYVANDKAETHL